MKSNDIGMGGSTPHNGQPISVQTHLPPQGRWVLVLTPKYRCLGYREGGVWRDVMHGRRINDPVVCWMPAGERVAG